MASILFRVLNVDKSPEVLEANPPSHALVRFWKNCDSALKRSNWVLNKESRRYGGNPLPWEPGGEQHFDRVSE